MFKNVDKKLETALILVAVGVLTLPGLSTAAPESTQNGGQLISATPYDSHMKEAGALIDFIPDTDTRSADELFMKARSFRYQADPHSRDHWQAPDETEQLRSGDCEDKALWLYAHLKKNGHRGVRLVVGRKSTSSSGFHVWVTLSSGDGSAFILDPTSQKRIWHSSSFAPESYIPLFSFDGLNRYQHKP